MLTPADARFGFALAGVRQREVTPAEIWSVLREAMADARIAVIAADERLLGGVDPVRLRELKARWSGILVNLPAPAGAADPAPAARVLTAPTPGVCASAGAPGLGRRATPRRTRTRRPAPTRESDQLIAGTGDTHSQPRRIAATSAPDRVLISRRSSAQQATSAAALAV